MQKRSKLIAPILFTIPCLAVIMIFVYYPLIMNVFYSFHSFGMSSVTKEFVGFRNYIELFSDDIVRQALINNTLYAIISLIFQVFGGLLLAAVLEDVFFRKVAPPLRTLYFIPTLISMAVVCLIFQFIYNPQMGLLNSFLELIGLEELQRLWLAEKEVAMYAIIAVNQWQSTGYIAMLFTVAIQKIPKDLYEAAEIDGAGKVKRFIHVTFPLVRQMLFVTMLITIIGAYTVFETPYIMTGGGPGYATNTLALHMYQSGVIKTRTGYASTVAMLIFAITATLSIVQLVLANRGDKGAKKRAK